MPTDLDNTCPNCDSDITDDRPVQTCKACEHQFCECCVFHDPDLDADMCPECYTPT